MAWLRCDIYPGQFSSEFAVVVTPFSGRQLSLFSGKNDLRHDKMPTRDHPVSGWISVEITECEDELCLVRLPQTTLENGPFITVRKSDLYEQVPETGMVNA
jgi:hypothetical protein